MTCVEAVNVPSPETMTPPVILARAGMWLATTAKNRAQGLADLREMLREVEAAVKEMGG